MAEAKESEDKLREPTVMDTSETNVLLVFMDGSMARAVATLQERKDKLIFYVMLTESSATLLGVDEKGRGEDERYDRRDGWYKLELKREWCLQLNLHPYLQTWLIFSNWDCKEPYNPMDRKYESLLRENQRILEERDSYWEKTKALNRRIGAMSKYGGAEEAAMVDRIVGIVTKVFLTGQKEKKE